MARARNDSRPLLAGAAQSRFDRRWKDRCRHDSRATGRLSTKDRRRRAHPLRHSLQPQGLEDTIGYVICTSSPATSLLPPHSLSHRMNDHRVTRLARLTRRHSSRSSQQPLVQGTGPDTTDNQHLDRSRNRVLVVAPAQHSSGRQNLGSCGTFGRRRRP